MGCFSPSGGGTERENVLTGGQNQLLDALTSLLIPQVGQGVAGFQGIRPEEVPFSQLQQQALDAAGGLTPAAQQAFGFDPSQGQGFLDTAQGALQEGLQGFDPQRITTALEPGRQLALNTFNQDIVPDLLERFGASSGASGSLNQALSEAGANLSLGLGAQAAPFLGQAALEAPGQQFAGAQLGADLAGVPGALAGQQVDLAGQGGNILSQLLGFGGVQQSAAQGLASAEQNRFLESQAFANPFLAQFLGPALGTSAFQAFQSPSGPSLFSQISSGASDLSGAFGSSPQSPS